MIEVIYEVYRFKKWWNNSFIFSPLNLPNSDKHREVYFKSEAYARDLGKIKNLTYKFIKNG